MRPNCSIDIFIKYKNDISAVTCYLNAFGWYEFFITLVHDSFWSWFSITGRYKNGYVTGVWGFRGLSSLVFGFIVGNSFQKVTHFFINCKDQRSTDRLLRLRPKTDWFWSHGSLVKTVKIVPYSAFWPFPKWVSLNTMFSFCFQAR